MLIYVAYVRWWKHLRKNACKKNFISFVEWKEIELVLECAISLCPGVYMMCIYSNVSWIFSRTDLHALVTTNPSSSENRAQIQQESRCSKNSAGRSRILRNRWESIEETIDPDARSATVFFLRSFFPLFARFTPGESIRTFRSIVFILEYRLRKTRKVTQPQDPRRARWVFFFSTPAEQTWRLAIDGQRSLYRYDANRRVIIEFYLARFERTRGTEDCRVEMSSL